jgi:CMP/dCMP kinase
MGRVPMIVTIDGPAGVGKTTLARRLAAELGIAYLDTGAMFRGVAWMLGPEALSRSGDDVREELGRVVFGLEGQGAESRLLVCGRPLPAAIRTEEVGMLASTLARREEVRSFLKEAQQELGRTRSLVAEGRDMGTVVFPGAVHKFFLDAAPEERARRRFRQLEEMGEHPDYEPLLQQIRARDEQDRTRAIAPLVPAEDAVIVDTTGLDQEGVFAVLMKVVEGKRGKAGKLKS